MINNITENSPGLWLSQFPWPTAAGHKYTRGHVVVAGGDIAHTGAARLAARSALRSGAGLVSIACDGASLPVYAASLEAVMTKIADNAETFTALAADVRTQALLIGPGCGVNEWTQTRALSALDSGKRTVLDADALTIFENAPEMLFQAIKTPCILTPHEGEFARLFSTIDAKLDRITRARQAAQLSHAVIILKGNETIIASPEGKAVVNKDATPFLATAGSGDVLAGLCVGLMAQGMEAFDAACAAVWIHTMAGNAFGAGLIAEDLPEAIPAILHLLLQERDQ